jgi:fumarate reductase flavoprotein subunit
MGRGPDVLLRLLADKLAAKGGVLRRGARAVALRMDGGACTGVELEGGEVIAARAVVVADGGFQANLEMFGQHITPRADKVKQRGAATGIGDGLRMAMDAGAAVTDLGKFYGHLLSRDAFHGNDKVWPYPELDAIAVAGMLVDEAGKRITDEGLGGISIANALAKSVNPLGAHIICDAAIWDGPGKAARIPANPQVERGGGTVHRADTLAGLAAKVGIPAEALGATVAAHNAALENGAMDRMDPPRSTLRAPAMPIRQAPFVAIPVCAGITYTMGGIAIDADARVKHRDGGVIPGLYAAGACTGGIEGGKLTGYVGGLSKSATFGFLAAEHAAAHILAAQGARA